MADQENEEVDDKTGARGIKRTSDKKIAEVSTGKSKKRAKKAQADTPGTAEARKLFEESFKRSDESLKRSRLEDAARDVAEGNITLEELDKALHDAVTERNIRLAGQAAFITLRSSQQPANLI